MNSKAIIVLLQDGEVTEFNPNKDPSGSYYDPTLVRALSLFDNYLIWLSLSIHWAVMQFGMSGWCGGSKIAITYTFQFLVLHLYCWVIPDRRYSSWVRSNVILFYSLAGLNALLYVACIFVGFEQYMYSTNGFK